MAPANPSVLLTWWLYSGDFIIGNAPRLLKIVDRAAAFRQRTRLEAITDPAGDRAALYARQTPSSHQQN